MKIVYRLKIYQQEYIYVLKSILTVIHLCIKSLFLKGLFFVRNTLLTTAHIFKSQFVKI